MTELSAETLRCLKSAGWTPGRSLDRESIKRQFLDRGFRPGPIVLDFLCSFGDLSLNYRHHKVRGAKDFCRLNIRVALAYLPVGISRYERVVRAPLTPVGQARRNHLVLIMSDAGSMYGAFEDIVLRVGSDGIDALNALCEGRQLEQLDSASAEDAGTARRGAALSAASIAVLSESGWSEERVIDTSAMEQTLRDHGYIAGPVVLGFLSRFGGLRLVIPPTRPSESSDECILCPLVCETFPRASISGYERRLGKVICPIGVAAKSTMFLLMAEDGEIFGGMADHPEILLQVGSTPTATINTLCERQPWVPLNDR